MTTYNIKVTDRRGYFFTAVSILFVGIKFMDAFSLGSKPDLRMLVNAMLCFLIWYSSRFTATGLVSFTVSEDAIQTTWLKRFLLRKTKDITFNRQDIKAYTYTHNRLASVIKIELNDGHTIEICQLAHAGIYDDFSAFRFYCEHTIPIAYQTVEPDSKNP